MKFLQRSIVRTFAAVAAAACVAATPVAAQQEAGPPAAAATLARAIAAELMMHCPLSDADDVAAFESCRAALREDGVLRRALPEFVMWGRNESGKGTAWKHAPVEQLAPEVWTHLYAPLFMFNGNHTMEWVPEENQFVIRLEAAFRNRLPAGQFPYPFWHEQAKWSAYQDTNGLLLWMHPQTGRIHVAQFTDRAGTPMLQPVQHVARSFDGQWLWTDQAGRTQPAVTLFDGLYRVGNPYRAPLDRQYRDLALLMREAQCSTCHVPSNPAQANRLVLLSTPAHAAGEIERVIRAVREDRLPAGASLQGHALSADDRNWLLQSAEAFRDTVRAARNWEAEAERRERNAQRRERAVAWRPVENGVALQPTSTLARP